MEFMQKKNEIFAKNTDFFKTKAKFKHLFK